MNKKLKLHLWMQWGLIGLVALLAVGYGVYAYVGSAPNRNIENVENYYEAEQTVVSQPSQVENLGGGSPDNVFQYESTNGDTTYHMTGSFQNGTTTILSFPSPFMRATSTAADVVIKNTTNNGFGYTAATTTVDLVRLDITTAATSTFSVTCGAAAADGTTGASTPGVTLLSASDVATSSLGMLENNLTAALGGIVDSGTVEKITLNGNYPYFTCLVTSVYPGAFTEATNAFDGKFTVLVHKQR